MGRGGRYDGLTANFGRTEPAVGFVLSLDALVEVLGRNKSTNGVQDRPVYSIESGDLSKAFTEVLHRRRMNEQVRIEAKK